MVWFGLDERQGRGDNNNGGRLYELLYTFRSGACRSPFVHTTRAGARRCSWLHSSELNPSSVRCDALRLSRRGSEDTYRISFEQPVLHVVGDEDRQPPVGLAPGQRIAAHLRQIVEGRTNVCPCADARHVCVRVQFLPRFQQLLWHLCDAQQNKI